MEPYYEISLHRYCTYIHAETLGARALVSRDVSNVFFVELPYRMWNTSTFCRFGAFFMLVQIVCSTEQFSTRLTLVAVSFGGGVSSLPYKSKDNTLATSAITMVNLQAN